MNHLKNFRTWGTLCLSCAGAIMLLLPALTGCGGKSEDSTGTTSGTSVSLSATPPSLTACGTVHLSWNSHNATNVDYSNFNATGVNGSVDQTNVCTTTTFSIRVTGAGGATAVANKTVIVNPNVPPEHIPEGSLLYSLANPAGGSTLYFISAGGGTATAVGTFPDGVTVLGTDLAGRRLLISKPLGGGSTKYGAFLTDLNGVSHEVRMGTQEFSQILDGSISAQGNVVVVPSDYYAYSYSTTGQQLSSNFGTKSSMGINGSGTSVAVAYTDRIAIRPFPSFDGSTSITSGGLYSWIRWSPVNAKLVYTDHDSIWTINTDQSSKLKIVESGSFPTFDSTGSRIFFSRVGLGVYVKDLNTGMESLVKPISDGWNGQIAWH